MQILYTLFLFNSGWSNLGFKVYIVLLNFTQTGSQQASLFLTFYFFKVWGKKWVKPLRLMAEHIHVLVRFFLVFTVRITYMKFESYYCKLFYPLHIGTYIHTS